MESSQPGPSECYKALSFARLVVLTGAGASVPLEMPAMDGFYKRLDPNWQTWVDTGLSSLGKPARDLEHLLSRLELYQALARDADKDNFLQAVLNRGVLQDLATQAEALREHIFDALVGTYGQLSAEQRRKAVEIYRAFYLGLLESAGNYPAVLPVFTTNYDLTFEALRDEIPDFRLCNGLEPQREFTVWRAELYKQKYDYNFPVFRLHGCSHWFKNKATGEILFQALPDRRDSAKKEPCVLYPIPGKDERIDEEPFRTAYQEFRRCLAGAETVVIVGYSGRDAAIQQCLREALAVNPEKRFVVVTGRGEVRPELAGIIPKHTLIHVPGGIEGHVNDVLDAVKGKLSVSVASSMQQQNGHA